ncbi:restriction endonuclease subunit S [Rhodospirillales bacterium]|nr:restriction endonuclease subunit S [Rhodospirillales bacterium]
MRLEEIAEINPRVTIRRGQSYPFVEMKDLEPSIRTVINSVKKNFSGSGSKFQYGDTLLARITPCLENGKTSQYRGEESPAWGSTEFVVIREKEGISDNIFLYYFVRSSIFREYAIQNMVGTSGRQRVPNDVIKDFKFSFPSLKDQKAIAHILGTLDDKIELNQKMNETLEEIAKAIFKSWFVDFDPVRAKMEGRPTGLPDDISDLFPDDLVDSEIGEIPKGWEVNELRSLVSLNSQNWTKRNHPNSVEYLDLGNIKSNRIIGTEKYKWDEAPSRARRVLSFGDTIVGTVRPGNKSFGFIQKSGITGSTGFAVLTPLQKEFSEFVYLCACSDQNIERLAHLADGAAYPAVGNEIILATICVNPPNKLLFKFHSLVSPLITKLEVASDESVCLSELRDTLLPRLISGELQIPDAEKFLEEVGI